MLEAVKLENKDHWNAIVKRFPDWDIYYLNEYVSSLHADHPDTTSVLLYFVRENAGMCLVMEVSDLADAPELKGRILPGTWYDMETPYGYGGPLMDAVTPEDLKAFREELAAWCRRKKIVSQFVRFHPLLNNAVSTEKFWDEVRYVHHTIAIDTSDKNRIMENMDSKNRNMVRKAEKCGVEIIIEENLDAIGDFKKIYLETMDFHNAGSMYYFSDNYYAYLATAFREHTILARAVYEGKTISASLFFYNENMIHYHLSGTLLTYRKLASGNLLLYKVACWAADRGIREFHLGGGMAEDDSLFGFKKQFNKYGYKDFYIGKTVFMPEAYRELLKLRADADENFDRENSRMIQYRA